MKRAIYFPVFFLTLTIFFAQSTESQSIAKEQSPNIIIILTDDQGYGDVGFNGCTDIPTPNFDRIANNGVKFTNGYVTYAVCGPSRAGLMTGRYQDRFGFGRNPRLAPNDAREGLPLSEETMATVLGKAGYTSVALGKWHLGAHRSQWPLNRGFNEFFGFLSGGHQYFPELWTFDDYFFWRKFDQNWYAARAGDIKLLQKKEEEIEFYNLNKDIGEEHTLSAGELSSSSAIAKAYKEWEDQMMNPIFMGLMQGEKYNLKNPDRFKVASPFTPDAYRPQTPVGYELVWADEFNGQGKPDEAYWSFEEGFVRNNELQWYQAENAMMDKGVLLFEGKREKLKNPSYNPKSDSWRQKREYAEYTSSSINTRNKFSFQYGVMEVRARIDTSMGSWPAIWTLGVERRWPENGEIDIMEFYLVNGKPSILANAAWKGEEKNEPTWDSRKIPMSCFLGKDPRWPEKFHVWKMVWDQDYIRLYLDEELLNEVDLSEADYPDGFNPFRQPHYILLNLALGSNGGDPSHTQFPLKYEVDYVRVYQKK